MAEFRINYGQVMGQAATINNLSADLDREIAKLEAILTTVNTNWKGPASRTFQNHLRLLIADMKTTKHEMSSVSTTIQNVATRIQQEDERLAEIARQQLAAAQAAAARAASATHRTTTRTTRRKK